MKNSDEQNLLIMYIYLAIGCVVVGVVITFLVLLATSYFDIDITTHIWLLAIPAVVSVFLNVLFIEVYRRHSKK